jgi:hypothetical protein
MRHRLPRFASQIAPADQQTPDHASTTPTAHNAMTASALMLYLIVPRVLFAALDDMQRQAVTMPVPAVPLMWAIVLNRLAAGAAGAAVVPSGGCPKSVARTQEVGGE